jgi:GNAT superfamily N-acetyltransferase
MDARWPEGTNREESVTVRMAETDDEIRRCYPVMRQLRPSFTLESFLERVGFQRGMGYHLVYLEVDGAAVAVAGYQIRETLVDGRFLHVDDLVTLDTERSRGHGAALLRWLVGHAEELACESLQLDTGVWREDAHRFYEREGLERFAYHYAVTMRPPST